MSETEITADALIADARAILDAAGATGYRVEDCGAGIFLVAVPEWHCSGCSSPKVEAFDTPAEVAQHFVNLRAGAVAEAGEAEEILQDVAVQETLAEDIHDHDGFAAGPDCDVQHPSSIDSDEAGANCGDPEPDTDVSERAAYPGIAITRNELEDLRNDVLGAISVEKRTRLKLASDKSREDWLAEQAQRYIHLHALGQVIPPETEQAYGDYIALKDRRERIQSHALGLEDAAAMAATTDMLRSILSGMDAGWP